MVEFTQDEKDFLDDLMAQLEDAENDDVEETDDEEDDDDE